MLSLHTNAAALSTQRNLGINQGDLTTAMTRLGTGYRINSAMDDAAGLQIATRLDTQTRGMKVAMRNTQDGISYLQTAEGALGEVSNLLLRMKDLATSAANGTASADDKKAMQSEYDELGKQINNIFSNTAFGGEKLLDDTSKLAKGTLQLQIGDSNTETMKIDGLEGKVGKAASGAGTVPATPAVAGSGFVGLKDALTKLSASFADPTKAGTELSGDPAAVKPVASKANEMIQNLANAINNVGEIRSGIGAVANRLQSTYNNLSNMSNNTSIAKGRIMDTDYASETATMTSHQMLMQAGTAMLKQSGSMNQMVMSLIQ